MNQCKTCRYWTRHQSDEYTEHDERFGNCSCEAFRYDASIRKHGNNDDTLLYMDYEGWEAKFEVGQHFGCIHHTK